MDTLGNPYPAVTADGQVSSYDLYHADWSYVPDLEFRHQDEWEYVAGEFVWTGFDYLGEPDPRLHDRRQRRAVYQRAVGQHENQAQYDYRLRWDDVTYQPGTVTVVAYKNGEEWATATMETAGAPAALSLEADRTSFRGDGRDLCFVKAAIVDSEGRRVPTANGAISFSVTGSGELVATDNGDAMDRTVFSSPTRNAFSGLALAIVRANGSQSGTITVTATSQGLTQGALTLTAE